MQIKVSMISCRLVCMEHALHIMARGTCQLGIIVGLFRDADDSPSNIEVFDLFFDCIWSRGIYVFVYFD